MMANAAGSPAASWGHTQLDRHRIAVVYLFPEPDVLPQGQGVTSAARKQGGLPPGIPDPDTDRDGSPAVGGFGGAAANIVSGVLGQKHPVVRRRTPPFEHLRIK